jgi:hypothetical protein
MGITYFDREVETARREDLARHQTSHRRFADGLAQVARSCRI